MDEKDQPDEKKEDGKVNINIGGRVNKSPIFAAGGDLQIENQQMNFDSNNTAINIADAFNSIYEQIEARPVDSDVAPEEIVTQVEYIQQEVIRGDEANGNKVKRWLRNVADMAPDIFDVTVATIINPVLGITEAIRKIAIKAREEYGHGN